MDVYMLYLRKKYGHPTPKKPQYSPHKHRPINYGAKQDISQPKYNSPYLYDKGVQKFQGIVGALIYVVRTVNNKLLVELIAIGDDQSAEIADTEEAIR